MRNSVVSVLALCTLATLSTLSWAEIEAEEIGLETMSDPQESWVLVRDGSAPFYVFDVATGDMHGLISGTGFTPATEVNLRRKEIYAAERYYSRRIRGERTDVVTVYDFENLAPVAEIVIPDKIASLGFADYIALMDDGRHLAVFNMNPGQSISIVDIRDRSFAGEISTPGCALIMPVEDRAFLQICGDGTLQKIGLDRNGAEASRSRSASFFSVDEDPVFDRPITTEDGWLLVSFEGKVFEVTDGDDGVSVSEPWSVLTEEDTEEGWRPGGYQLAAYDETYGLIFLLMHQGGEDTHEDPGSEVWVLSRSAERRIARIPLGEESLGTHIHVTKGDEPLLAVTGIDRKVHVFDVATTRHLRSIEGVGSSPGLIQGFH